MFSYDYHEKEMGAFKNLSDSHITGAQTILNEIKKTNVTFAAHR
jgi:hypothetical protein